MKNAIILITELSLIVRIKPNRVSVWLSCTVTNDYLMYVLTIYPISTLHLQQITEVGTLQ
jgi:hypothetical protein